MEGLVDNAKKFMSSDEGKNMMKQFGGDNQATGDPQVDSSAAQQGQGQGQGSTDAFGNQGQPGQFGEEGQYGAVRGKGFGGALAKGPNEGGKSQGQGQGGAYEGYQQDDTTAEGGWGGDVFGRKNQMAADEHRNDGDATGEGGGYGDQGDEPSGYKTGTSTPGYRQEGDVDAEAAENRIRNQNMNKYGQQSDDRGSTGNDYNEAI